MQSFKIAKLNLLHKKALHGMMIGMIFIDLQKAFDTIDHGIVLQILYAIVFSKHSVNSLTSYLTNLQLIWEKLFSDCMFMQQCTTRIYSWTSFLSMICLRITFSFMLTIHVLLVNIKTSIKKKKILRMSGCFITNQLNIYLGDEKTKSTFQP